jgi:mannan endo-1,4-beta-mannosidase
LPWIATAPGVPYFHDEHGRDWTPIGQNDAVTWPDLAGLFRRRDLGAVSAYLRMLRAHGVTCLRLMLEYCHGEHRYLERPAGRFQPNMVRLWDDLFALCELHGLRILLTPYDTFWMWIRWSRHPYASANGGPCGSRRRWLLCSEMRAAVKQRLAFATERWGGSGALFAWDLWNEIHPAHAEDSAECFDDFVEDVSGFLRRTELRLHGRTHPQTVSVFGPAMAKDPRVAPCAFRHPSLDFASVHFYEFGTIDNPRNTIDPAVAVGRLTREALAEIVDKRPFFDSEHGPIHTFKDKKVTLSEPFDDEYFRHIQWAHLASGGAGGGMRWPNRHPHSLTPGMRAAQRSLAAFLPLVDHGRFQRRNWNREIEVSDPAFAPFGCGDGNQAVLWLLRTDATAPDGTLLPSAPPRSLCVRVRGLRPGRYRVTTWDTRAGAALAAGELRHTAETAEDSLTLPLQQVRTDVAVALQRTGD